MELLTEELRQQIPLLYSQENNPDPMVICKFFDPSSSWTWYVIEGEERENNNGKDILFFGFVIGIDAELGYFTLHELKTAKQGLSGLQGLPIERNLCFTPERLSKVKEFHKKENNTFD